MERNRQIVVRAFFWTGKDGQESLIDYIGALEDTVLKLDKVVSNRTRSRSRTDLDQVMKRTLRTKREAHERIIG